MDKKMTSLVKVSKGLIKNKIPLLMLGTYPNYVL
jgi:hypothetical protein